MPHPQDTRRQFAQGDLLFTPLAALPLSLKASPVAPEQGRLILAYGEVTGHHHSVPMTAVREAVRDEGGVTYLTLDQLTAVEHQEHAAIPMDPGLWQVRRQREASDADESWAWVGD